IAFDNEGNYRTPTAKDYADARLYSWNVKEADRIFGKILQATTSRPALSSNSVLIVTSDHSWRQGLAPKGIPPGYAEKIRHVPLLIHWPGQTNQIVITNRFDHLRLPQILKAALTNADLTAAEKILQAP